MKHEPPGNLAHNTMFGTLFDLGFKVYLASKTGKAHHVLATIVAGFAAVGLLVLAVPASPPLALLGLTIMFPLIFPATAASFWGLL